MAFKAFTRPAASTVSINMAHVTQAELRRSGIAVYILGAARCRMVPDTPANRSAFSIPASAEVPSMGEDDGAAS